MLLELTRFRQRRQLVLLRLRRINLITSASVRPATWKMSSNVIRSAHAAHITQSLVPLTGSGYAFRVTGHVCFFLMGVGEGSSRRELRYWFLTGALIGVPALRLAEIVSIHVKHHIDFLGQAGR